MPNRLALSIATCLAVLVSVGAGAALATDDVPAPPDPTPCTDDIKPTSTAGAKLAAGVKSRVIRGTAKDLGCSVSGVGAVKTVGISVARKNGAYCQNLAAGGKIGKATWCGRPTWLPAKGTATWTFKLPKKLPKGTYVIRTRAVDADGNVERPKVKRVVVK